MHYFREKRHQMKTQSMTWEEQNRTQKLVQHLKSLTHHILLITNHPFIKDSSLFAK